MRKEEKEKLLNHKSKYISIGITDDGIAYNGFGIPWESTSNAYNMRLPDVFITPDDLNDEETMSLIRSKKVIGCYCWSSLENFDFVSHFSDIEDVNIFKGENLKNIDFVKSLKELRMLFVGNAKFDNIDAILEIPKSDGQFIRMMNIGLYNCEVKDLSTFLEKEHKFYEFLVWNRKEKIERKKWQVVSALKRKIYEIESELIR